jgi:AcrR family transcriptional regulator
MQEHINTTLADRRGALLDPLADHTLEVGLEKASLRALAKATGTSDRMLMYYFSDKSNLMSSILDRLVERIIAMLDSARQKGEISSHQLLHDTQEMMSQQAVWPYVQIWLELTAKAARGDKFARSVGNRIGTVFYEWALSQLTIGELKKREAEAASILVRIEGAALLKALDLESLATKSLDGAG